MLKVDHLTIEYPDQLMFSDVSFEVNDGEILAIISEVLDGGTSLLKSLAGMLTGIEGRITLDGIDVLGMHPRSRALAIGYAYEQQGLISLYNVFQNIALPLEFHTDLDAKQTQDRIVSILQELDIDPSLLRLQPHDLNDVQTRLINVARAMILEPKLLLIDELEGGMPEEMIDSVMQVLMARKQRTGQMFVMTTSDERILREADRVLKIEDRQLLEQP
ncbi:MAG: ATP-binding cassette domain-containing protein [Betaproteobacteria bacterium]